MPTYAAKCDKCGAVVEYVASIADRHRLIPSCCGELMQAYICYAPYSFVGGQFDAFISPVDGSVVHNNRELKEHNIRNNVVNIHDGYSEERVLAGDYLKRPELDKKERVEDIKAAIRKLEAGYKPVKGAQDEIS